MRLILFALILTMLVTAGVKLESVQIEKLGNYTYSNVVEAAVSFSMGTAAPLGVGKGVGGASWKPSDAPTTEVWGVRGVNTTVAAWWSYAQGAKWEGDLRFSVTLEYYDSNGVWSITKYFVNKTYCEYDDATGAKLYCWNNYYVYHVVEGEPSRVSTTVTFTVPSDRARYSASQSLKVNKPPQPFTRWVYIKGVIARESGYCSSIDSWGDCQQYTPKEDKVVRGSSPGVWRALEIDGYKPGDVVRIGGANATIPDPWLYTDWPLLDLAPSLGVSTDIDGVLRPLRGGLDIPFDRRVYITGDVSPTDWGTVEIRPPRDAPLYISRVVFIGDVSKCRFPDCIIIDTVGNSTWVGDRWVWRDTMASLAFKTPFTLKPYLITRVGGAANPYQVIGDPLVTLISREAYVYVPYGSVGQLWVEVKWMLDLAGRRVWVGDRGTALRAVDDRGRLLDYETAGARGKLAYYKPGYNAPIAGFSFGIDAGFGRLTTAFYSPPDPCRQWPTQIFHCVYSQHVFTKVNGTWVGYARVGPRGGPQWPITRLRLVDWLIGSDPYVSVRGYFLDFMSAVVGDPHLLYHHYYRLECWAFNPQTGDFDIPDMCPVPGPHQVSLLGRVYGISQYLNTTRGWSRLYHQTAMPRGLTFYNYAFGKYGGGTELPAGWTDALPLGVSSMIPNGPSPWFVFLAPATACDGTICTSTDVRVWGPVPGPLADLALPGAGYAFVLIYMGNVTKASVRVYVEKGLLVNASMGVREANWDLLVEIPEREWRPLDVVYLGYGWYRLAGALGPCQSLRVGRVGYYAAPVDWVGPVQLKITDGKGSHHFAFLVAPPELTALKIGGRTEAPARANGWQLNLSAYLYVNGVPYFHGFTPFGEGGRQYERKCVAASLPAPRTSLLGEADAASQLAASGDFWGLVEMYARARLEGAVVEPKFELVDPDGGLVNITAEGPVKGFAFYLQRGGVWVKVTEVNGTWALVDVSRVFPWDPVAVVPIVEFEAYVRNGGVVTVWRPRPSLLFKAWADGLGYPDGQSELRIVAYG